MSSEDDALLASASASASDARSVSSRRGGMTRVLASVVGAVVVVLASVSVVSTRGGEARAREGLGDALDASASSVWSHGHLVTPEALGAPRPVAAVAAQPAAQPAKAAKAKKAKKAKKPKARPKGLPSEFEIAPATARFTGSLANFIINYGLLVGAAFVVVFVNSTVANSASILGAMALYFLNVFVIPVRFGRNVGQFVSRTKYISATGNPPMKIHAVLNSMVGFLFLVGGILVMFNKW